MKSRDKGNKMAAPTPTPKPKDLSGMVNELKEMRLSLTIHDIDPNSADLFRLHTSNGHCVFGVSWHEKTIFAHQCFGKCNDGPVNGKKLPMIEMRIPSFDCMVGEGITHQCGGECSKYPDREYNAHLCGTRGGGKSFTLKNVNLFTEMHKDDDIITPTEYVKKIQKRTDFCRFFDEK